MAWFKEVLIWVLAFYYVVYDHIAGAIRALVAVFKPLHAEPILPVAVTRNSFNNEFNPVEGGIRTCLGYLTSTRSDDPTPAIPWVQFNPAIRRYSQKTERATPQYGTYPPSSPIPDHDASALTVVLDNNASSPSQMNAPSPDGPPETSPLPMDNALVVCSSAAASPAASTELSPSAPATISTVTEMEQAADLFKGEVINDAKDADSNNLAMVRYQPVVGTSSGRHGGVDTPPSTSFSTFKVKGVVTKHVSNVPVLNAAVEHQIIEREPMLDISAFMSPQLEFESVFKTFIPDVDSDGNRLSAILDQPLEFFDGAPVPHSAMVLGMNARFRRKAYRPIIKALVRTAGEDSLDDLMLEPREVQKSPSLTLMEKCLAISISVRSSPIIQEETLSGEFIFSYLIFISVIDESIWKNPTNL
jgi:hypothetical protein